MLNQEKNLFSFGYCYYSRGYLRCVLPVPVQQSHPLILVRERSESESQNSRFNEYGEACWLMYCSLFCFC